MIRKETKLKVKNELKVQAREIRKLKSKRKGAMNGFVDGILYASEEYREKHVAYCIFFNNTLYESIEQNPRVPLDYKEYSRFIYNWQKEINSDKTIYINS